MGKKGIVDGVSRREPQIINDRSGIIYVICVASIVWIIYRSGYRAGVDVSNKVLKRHDKDVRKMKKEAAKREKQLRRELAPEEEQTKWWWPWNKSPKTES